MGKDNKTDQTFMTILGRDLGKLVDWSKRLENSDNSPLHGPMDGSFGDVVCQTRNARVDRLTLDAVLWAYDTLLSDRQTHPEVVSALLPPLSDAFVDALKKTPLDEQDLGDLTDFRSKFGKDKMAHFRENQQAMIGAVLETVADSISRKNAPQTGSPNRTQKR